MKTIKFFLLCLVNMYLVNALHAQTVYQWRGPARDGIYNETGLLSQWPEEGPRLLWSTEELGAGYAAPCVTNNKLLINGVIGSDSYLFAFDLNGTLIWKSPNGKEFEGSGYSSNFPGARSTPTVIGDLVYATTGLGRMACFNINTGKELWAVNMVRDFNGYLNEFGYSESIVADDKNIYCFPGGKNINIAAINRFTGKTIWTSEAAGDTTHFVSPILVELQSGKIFVSVSRHYIFGVDCSNGDLLWKYKIAFKYDGEHCNTPVYDAPYIYLATGEGKGKGTIKLELAPDGKSVKEVWTNKQVKNSLGGFVVINHKLFVTTENKYLNVLDPENGAVINKVRAPFGGLIFADNKFICYGNNGDVSLFNYESDKFIPGGTFKITKGSKEHFAHPVVSNGVLYIRHGEALMAYKIK